MRVYLHIGLPKTGSSAIQSWLSAHSKDLAGVGVTYADLMPKAKLEQISGGNGLSYEEMIKLDLAYIRSWSLWLDVRLLARTLPALVHRHDPC